MARSGSSEGVYGLRYLTIVAAATLAVSSLALLARSRESALGAAVLGIYALHLLSVRLLLRNQRRHEHALLAQMELLHRLADPDAAPAEATPDGSADREPGREPSASDGPGPADSRREPMLREGRPSLSAGTAPAGGSAPRRGPGGPRSRAPVPSPRVVPVTTNGAPDPAGDASRSDEAAGAAATERGAGGSTDRAESGAIPIPRHFALGTVALIRQLLTPPEVARVLMEQRRQPDRRFATLAVEMGLLTDTQREELLLAQQEGLFTEQEMREARERLREFRESTARALSDLD